MPYNKKIAVVYKSKYGSTMKYAGWLAMRLDADLYEISDVGRWDLLKYKTIIFGSPIYNNRIYLQYFLEQKYHSIRNKQIVLFCVGINLQSREDIIKHNFKSEEMINNIKVFLLDGFIDFDKLNQIDKLKLKINEQKFNLDKVANLDKNMKMDKSTIIPIINYIEGKSTGKTY